MRVREPLPLPRTRLTFCEPLEFNQIQSAKRSNYRQKAAAASKRAPDADTSAATAGEPDETPSKKARVEGGAEEEEDAEDHEVEDQGAVEDEDEDDEDEEDEVEEEEGAGEAEVEGDETIEIDERRGEDESGDESE